MKTIVQEQQTDVRELKEKLLMQEVSEEVSEEEVYMSSPKEDNCARATTNLQVFEDPGVRPPRSPYRGYFHTLG